MARLMRENRLVRLHKRRSGKPRHPNIEKLPNIAENVLQRRFTASNPNLAWVADFTYVRVAEGWLFVAAVMDLFSRRVVGWSFSQQADEDIVTAALEGAVHLRRPAAGLIHHCDQGSQYTATRYGNRLAANRFISSMSRRCNCHDNAVIESFFSALKRELEFEKSVTRRREAQDLVNHYIEHFYNRNRLHSTLGFLSPAEYELLHIA